MYFYFAAPPTALTLSSGASSHRHRHQRTRCRHLLHAGPPRQDRRARHQARYRTRPSRPFYSLAPRATFLTPLCCFTSDPASSLCVVLRACVCGGVCVCHETVSVRPSNAGRGLPTVPAVVMLLDEPTGLPVALMQASSPLSLCYTTVVVELTFLFHFPVFPSTGDAADRHPHCGGLRGRHQRAGQEERARHGGVRYAPAPSLTTTTTTTTTRTLHSESLTVVWRQVWESKRRLILRLSAPCEVLRRYVVCAVCRHVCAHVDTSAALLT